MSCVVVIGALPESLINFRGDLLKAMVAAGHKVTAMASDAEPELIAKLAGMGVDFISYPVQRNGLNPLQDIGTYLALRRSIVGLEPDVVLAYTIKPVIWGCFAARNIPGTSVFAMIEGLGFAFQGKTVARKLIGFIAATLYRVALSRASRVIFLNPDNRRTFVDLDLISDEKAAIIDGIGLDLSWYSSVEIPNGNIVFLTIARLLGEKGLREYARAAEIVGKRYPETQFRLVGQADPSPDGVPLDEVLQWESGAGIKYLGATDDVRPFLADCHVYVLPSYHEGMPRTVMEAMAVGRPIITTDVPGCRETVIPGENGWLVPKADAAALAERMIWFIEHRDQLPQMGRNSRRMAEDRFDVHTINRQLMQLMALEHSC